MIDISNDDGCDGKAIEEERKSRQLNFIQNNSRPEHFLSTNKNDDDSICFVSAPKLTIYFFFIHRS